MSASLQAIASHQVTAKLKSVSPFLKGKETDLVLPFLHFEDLIAFEMAAPGHTNITYKAWKILSVKDYATATFSDCEKEQYHEKLNYVLSKIACLNLFEREPNLANAIAIEKRFSFFLNKPNRFKNFSGYLEKIIRIKWKARQPDSAELVEKLSSLENTAFQGSTNGKWSGDILLQGQLVVHYKGGWSNENLQYYVQAIRNGACCKFNDGSYTENHLTIALEGSIKKDFRSLERYLEKPEFTLSDLVEMQKKYGCHAPLLWKIFQKKSNGMSDQEKADKFEQLLDDTYKWYGFRAPKELLLTLAQTKVTLNKWKEAEKLYEKITAAFNCNFNESFFTNMIRAKLTLSKFKEAGELIDQSLKLPNPTPYIYQLAFATKFYQSDFEKSEKLIPFINLKWDMDLYLKEKIAYIILLKLQLGKEPEIDEYIKNFITISKDLEKDRDDLFIKANAYAKHHGKLKKYIVGMFLHVLYKNSMPKKDKVIAQVSENSMPASVVAQNIAPKRNLILIIYNVLSKIKFLCRR